jgi:hypothetical protein
MRFGLTLSSFPDSFLLFSLDGAISFHQTSDHLRPRFFGKAFSFKSAQNKPDRLIQFPKYLFISSSLSFLMVMMVKVIRIETDTQQGKTALKITTKMPSKCQK